MLLEEPSVAWGIQSWWQGAWAFHFAVGLWLVAVAAGAVIKQISGHSGSGQLGEGQICSRQITAAQVAAAVVGSAA